MPAFVSRAFRHNSIWVRTDRIKTPADLKGKRVGLPEYQLTACVWARIILEDDHGVKPSDIAWVRGGIEDPGRPEKITIKLPPGVHMENAPEGATISGMLERGEIDGFIAPRVPTLAGRKHPAYRHAVCRSDRGRQGLFQAHRHFPDHARHRHPPHAGGEASLAAGGGVQGVLAVEGEMPGGAGGHRGHEGDAAVRRGSACAHAREFMGEDFWSYGLAPNRKGLETFLRHHHAQGLSSRLVAPEELFHPSTHESFTI